MRLEARINYVPAKGGTADNRMRLMPAAGPGVYLNPEQIGEVLNLLTEEDDCEGAGEALLEHFAAEYGFLELIEALEENDVVGLKLWPDGDPEPP
jgi:hypothetical protein